MRGIVIILTFLCCSCCGYQLTSPVGCQWHRYSYCVPFAKGDHDGHFTEAFIQTLVEGGYHYQSMGASAVIWITLENLKEESIGFRYDRDRQGQRRDSLIPSETRLLLTAYVRVISEKTGCDLIEPFHITAFTEFDHEFYSVRDEVNQQSLGQVTDVDDARDAAMRPLNRRLSQKIIDYLSNTTQL